MIDKKRPQKEETGKRILRQNSLARARFTQQAKRGRRLLIEAVVLTEAVVGFAENKM